MSKVFRIHKDSAPSVEDWSGYSAPDLKEIAKQIDTADGDGTQLPSSIPSPFARIDLVKSAFEKVGEEKKDDKHVYNLDDQYNYHKLISDSLDIGEIFFNYNTHKENLKIVRWSKQDDLEKLTNSQNNSHKLLGDTFDLFIKQDNQYGLKNIEDIFILKYNYNVIGATNPVVLFFASPDSHKVVVNINFDNDKMLDREYKALYKRNIKFVKFYLALVYSNKDQFDSLLQYANRTKNLLSVGNPSLAEELDKIQNKAQSYFDNTKGLEVLHVDNSGRSPVHILQKQKTPIYQHTEQHDFSTESDFVIKGDRESSKGLPLVLPNGIFRDSSFKYTLGTWDPKTTLPTDYDKIDLIERRLPNSNELYPWISENDIFEDIIIKSDLSYNSDRYETIGDDKFLIPIKPEFLEWFNIETIIRNISVQILAGNDVQVKLNVPVAGGSIPIERIYSNSKQSNKCSVINLTTQNNFGLGIYPFFKSQEQYYLSLVHKTESEFEIESFEYKNSTIHSDIHKAVNRGNTTSFSNKIYKLNKFDSLAIKIKEGRNLIVPKFLEPKNSGAEEMYAAIDFGTTNTHVEISINNDTKPLNFQGIEIVGLLIKNPDNNNKTNLQSVIGNALNSDISQTFIDNDFGQEEFEIKAPFRTCLLENNSTDYDEISLFENKNIGFDYEKRAIKDYLSSNTDIKWGSKYDDRKIYIKELCKLLKTKSITENIRPENVKLSWLYPLSMSTSGLEDLERIWNKEFTINFGTQNITERLINLPESITPYFHARKFMDLEFKKGKENSISIDIGGGTTDIMYFSADSTGDVSDSIKFISSFKFAGNSIFGGGKAQANIELNGFYKKHLKPLIEEFTLDESLDSELLKNLKKIKEAEQLINFFFSLENSSKNVKISETIKQDKHIKLGFILMYSSIIFHIAELFKSKGINEVPKNIVFSGTGSKTLNFVGSSTNNYKQISKLATGIFESVLGIEIEDEIAIKVPDYPKEITCRGSIQILRDDAKTFEKFNHLNKISHSLIGGHQDLEFESIKTYADLKDEVVMKNIISSLESKTKEFVDIIKDLDSKLDFSDIFGVSKEALRKYEEILLSSIEHSVHLTLKDKDPTDRINETLFFNSLNTNLPKLIYELSQI